MVREEAERLDVEGEVLRGALHPQPGCLLGRHGIVGGVHLDDGEGRGIVLQPLLGGFCLSGIPATRQKSGISPGASAHQYLRHHVLSHTTHRTRFDYIKSRKRPLISQITIDIDGVYCMIERNMRGGKRNGAGAPRGNLNRLTHGARSETL